MSTPGEAIAMEIAENVASLRDIPMAEWCGNPEGDAARAGLIALAEAGADVYAYRSASGRWNVWFLNERLTPAELVIRMGQENGWLSRIVKKASEDV